MYVKAETEKMEKTLNSCCVSCLPGRYGARHISHRPGRHTNCGGGGHVLHHLLRLHRGPAREHPPPQDGKKTQRAHCSGRPCFASDASAISVFSHCRGSHVSWAITNLQVSRDYVLCCIFLV